MLDRSVNSELGRMWREAVVVLAVHLLGENEDSHAHCRRIARVRAEIQKYQVAAPLSCLRLLFVTAGSATQLLATSVC